MDCAKCGICQEEIPNNEKLYVTLTEKGALGACNASKERGEDFIVNTGDNVHRSCQGAYINKKNIISYNKKKLSTDAEGNVGKRSLRADQDFDFKKDCLFCKNRITEGEKRANKAYQVMCKNREFDSSILKVCEQRNDLWAMDVKGCIAFVNDLHSEDAVYHQARSANFRTGKGIPQLYDDGPKSKPSAKRGRPSDKDRESAFLFVENYLKENDDEQTTVNDLFAANARAS